MKDISGQSSHALVKGDRPVTANSHAAPFGLRSHSKALCSCYFLFHPITVLLFPHSLSLSRFRFLSSSRHAPSCLWRPDRGTQAALIGVDRWLCAAKASGVTAQPGWPVVVTKANACPKHTHPTQTAPLLPICQNAHQQRHFVKNAQFFHFLSFFMSCSFHLFFLAKLNFQASSYSVVYLSFLSLHALLSHTGPLLTPPGLTITSE